MATSHSRTVMTKKTSVLVTPTVPGPKSRVRHQLQAEQRGGDDEDAQRERDAQRHLLPVEGGARAIRRARRRRLSTPSAAVCSAALDTSSGLSGKQAMARPENSPSRGWHWKALMRSSGAPEAATRPASRGRRTRPGRTPAPTASFFSEWAIILINQSGDRERCGAISLSRVN